MPYPDDNEHARAILTLAEQPLPHIDAHSVGPSADSSHLELGEGQEDGVEAEAGEAAADLIVEAPLAVGPAGICFEFCPNSLA
jgi:hypothetical protein